MKIDIVYTWVTSNDPSWINKRDKYLSNDLSVIKPNNINNDRYTDSDELKYSLRSVFEFMPFINHIYIVTDNQRPEWLKNCDKITIVDHTEIIPKEFLPTFNSSVIESFIHKIKGLSEHFIYFNDDLIIGRPCCPDDFFSNGKIKIFTTSLLPNKSRKNSDDYDAISMRTSQSIINKELNKKVNFRFRHSVKPMIKSRLEIVESNLSHIVNNMPFENKFRMFPFSFIYLYLYHESATRNAVLCYQRHIRNNSIVNLFCKNSFLHISKENEIQRINLLAKTTPMVICINSISSPLSKINEFSIRFKKNTNFEI